MKNNKSCAFKLFYYALGLISFSLFFFFANTFYAEAGTGRQYGTWYIKCDKQKNCSLKQVLQLEEKNGKRVAEYRIGYFGGDKIKFISILPFGVNLKQGPKLFVDKNPIVDCEYTTCQAYGCIAQTVLGQDALDKIYNAENAYISIKTVDNKTLNIKFSTRGLKEGITDLSKI